jgi:hypothetical protein
MAVSFISGGNRSSTRSKPLTPRKSLTNFITCFIEYNSAWTGFELTTLVVIGTDCHRNLNSWIYNYLWQSVPITTNHRITTTKTCLNKLFTRRCCNLSLCASHGDFLQLCTWYSFACCLNRGSNLFGWRPTRWREKTSNFHTGKCILCYCRCFIEMCALIP